MRLHSMRLQNFRQHADSYITFAPGLTGIVGANGGGKSTILEGLAFGFYGTTAARGVKDGIKWNRAAARASVRVEIDFALAGHRYRVVRGLTMAELYLDDAVTPMANSLSGVSEQMQRILGMTRDEFFMTYFTGQKDLAAMANLGPTERGKFLSRAFGLDRIGRAWELVRDRRRELVSEISGLRLAIPEFSAIERAIAEAEMHRDVTRERLAVAYDARTAALARLALAEPAWKASLVHRDRDQALATDLRVLQADLRAADSSVVALTAQLASIDAALVESRTLDVDVRLLPEMRNRLQALDALAAENAARQQAVGTVASLNEQIAQLDSELAAIALVSGHLESLLEAANTALTVNAEAKVEHERARQSWAQQTSDAESDLKRLRNQHTTLQKQRAELLEKGADGNCAACGQPLGDSWKGALTKIDADIATVIADGTAAKATADNVAIAPAEVLAAEARVKETARAVDSTERAFQAERDRVRDHGRVTTELDAKRQRRTAASAGLNDMMQTYDAGVHTALRTDVAALAVKETRMAVLQASLDRMPQVSQELNDATARRDQLRGGDAALSADRAALAFNEEAHAAIVREQEAASQGASKAEVDTSIAEGEANRAVQALGFALKQRDDSAAARTKLAAREVDRLRHEELERAFTTLRAQLNDQLRPELAEIASGLMDVLTDGRYTEASFDENYVLSLVDDGVAKGVISGGEEDLCNLVLRLAISQMIAARAGHAFSLLILDEVFGSLDDARRENVMALLRGLNDRFEQVIVISHIGQIRDGLDNVIQVQFDADTGASVVTNGDGTPMLRAADELLRAAA